MVMRLRMMTVAGQVVVVLFLEGAWMLSAAAVVAVAAVAALVVVAAVVQRRTWCWLTCRPRSLTGTRGSTSYAT